MDAMTDDNDVPSAHTRAPKPDATPDSAPAMPEQTAQLLDATIADMVEERLAARLAELRGAQLDPGGHPHPSNAGGLLLVDLRTLPEPAEVPPPERQAFIVHLPPRFAAYVASRAEAHGQDVSEHLAVMVRWFWQQDIWRQQPTFQAPEVGRPAGTSLRS